MSLLNLVLGYLRALAKVEERRSRAGSIMIVAAIPSRTAGGAVAGRRWPVLDPGQAVVVVHAGQVQQHREPGGPLYQVPIADAQITEDFVMSSLDGLTDRNTDDIVSIEQSLQERPPGPESNEGGSS